MVGVACVAVVLFGAQGCGGGDSDPGNGPAAGGTGGAAGTGGSSAPLSTLWLVDMGTATWSCSGNMALTVQDGGGASGSWHCTETAANCAYRQVYVSNTPCLQFTGMAAGQFRGDGSVTLSLATDATHALPVAGTLSGSNIVATAMFANENAQFNAILVP